MDLFVFLRRYKFLIKQLVVRDFKIKYKRSVLGALWSFVNPLLIMCVQYVVFSTIFKADIENYQVYLLSGIVLFNFFSESSNVAMYAVTGNAGLITKVYVPKYIYPVTKVLSTSVNLMISLLPLLIITLVSGVNVTRAWLLIPFVLVCLLVFCCGIALILSAALVFFRDIQFIWSVFLMILTYATPVFYPEEILTERFRGVLSFNPMYHFIKFFRLLVMDGLSPEPVAYAQCAVIAGLVLALGVFVFHQTQDRFVYYL
ncbi:MAG: ABC transporter permease [Eubacterium sp.]|nr:ABC transporter permease [Eubacterium sp.]